jgi:hypothetical protein
VIAAKVIMCKDKFYGMGIGPFYICFIIISISGGKRRQICKSLKLIDKATLKI